jgi:3-oxoacyl-[acyl-carrier protein] reductase
VAPDVRLAGWEELARGREAEELARYGGLLTHELDDENARHAGAVPRSRTASRRDAGRQVDERRVMKLDLAGRRAVVSGGSRGVGAAVARMLAAAGADVGIAYLSRHAEAERMVNELQRAGVRAFAQAGDLADAGQAERLFARADEEFGGLDTFVGNAGIWPPQDVPIARMTDEQWRRTLAINLDAIFYCTRAAARRMGADGRIVIIGSTAGQRGEAGHADYAASKGALMSLVKGVAVELAPSGTTVNCVAPGWIDTEMAEEPYAGAGRARIEAGIPLGRVATADDVAGPVVFLCSTLARHITGEVLNVNGGSVLCG